MRIDPTRALGAVPASLRHLTLGFPLALTVFACAHRGTSPHDMGAQAHEEAAQQAAAESRRLQESPCPPTKGETVQSSAVCWTPSVATDAQRARAAEQQQRLAAAHRNAAAELRAEADAACAGVAASDRETSPFSHPEDLDGAKPLRGPHSSKLSIQPIIGVTIFVRPVPGLTEQRLQRLVNCHVAQNALLGHVSPGEPDCPLVPAGVTATVRSVQDRLAVDVKGSSLELVKEIEARTRRLVGNRWTDS